MAYPYYYNNYSPIYQQPAVGVPTNAPTNSGIVWVQGEAGAKSYLVGAGQSVLLMDSEGSCFYIKSTDQSGMPMPLRTFDYKERSQSSAQSPVISNDYVTREEFDAFKRSLKEEEKDEKPAF